MSDESRDKSNNSFDELKISAEKYYIREFQRKRRIAINALAAAVTFISLILSLTEITDVYQSSRKTDKAETIENRIEKLTKSLLSASYNISEIEREIEQRKNLAIQLKSDADQAQRLKNLNSEQIAAVSQALRGQIREENKESYWSNFITNLIFAFIGALFGEFIRFFRNLIKQK